MALSTVNREGTSFTLIDDSFNANPDSMKAGLNGLKAWNSNDGKEPFRVALLGAMLELGADETALHTSIGTYADELGIDAIIAVGSAQDQHLDALAQALADGARQSNPRRWIAYTTSMRPNSWSSTWLATIPTLWYCSRDRTRQA